MKVKKVFAQQEQKKNMTTNEERHPEIPNNRKYALVFLSLLRLTIAHSRTRASVALWEPSLTGMWFHRKLRLEDLCSSSSRLRVFPPARVCLSLLTRIHFCFLAGLRDNFVNVDY